MKLGFTAIFAAVVVASSAHAEAADTKGVAEKGNLFISADRLFPLLSYTYASTTRTESGVELTNSQSGTAISLLYGQNLAVSGNVTDLPNVHTIPRVAADITVIHNLTVGAGLAFAFGLGGTAEQEARTGAGKTSSSQDTPTLSAIGFTPRVGYILPLTDLFAFWPRAGLGIYSVSGATEGLDTGVRVTNRLTYTMFSLDIDPQFMIVPVEHFFVHAGPILNIPLAGSVTATREAGSTQTETSLDASLFNLGLSAGIGGYFNVF